MVKGISKELLVIRPCLAFLISCLGIYLLGQPTIAQNIQAIDTAESVLSRSQELLVQDKVSQLAEVILKLKVETMEEDAGPYLLPLAQRCWTLSENDGLSEGTRSDLAAMAEDLVQKKWDLDRRSAISTSAMGSIRSEILESLIPHVINTSNNGGFSDDGAFVSTPEQVTAIFNNADKLQTQWIQDGLSRRRDLLIYAHGGLVSEKAGLRAAKRHIELWMSHQIYPINIVWQSGLGETLKDIKEDKRPVEAAGFIRFNVRAKKITLSPRLVERAARKHIAPLWSKMKENAIAISSKERSSESEKCAPGDVLVQNLVNYSEKHPGELRIHLVGHSAGSIVLSGLIPLLHDRGLEIASISLLAPAITVDAFDSKVSETLKNNQLCRSIVFNLSAKQEEEDIASIGAVGYPGSLLLLVSRCLETADKGDETPLLGLTKFLTSSNVSCQDVTLKSGLHLKLIQSPSDSEPKCNATSHSDFDDDGDALNSVIEAIKLN